jgi:hypothetical protein
MEPTPSSTFIWKVESHLFATHVENLFLIKITSINIRNITVMIASIVAKLKPAEKLLRLRIIFINTNCFTDLLNITAIVGELLSSDTC